MSDAQTVIVGAELPVLPQDIQCPVCGGDGQSPVAISPVSCDRCGGTGKARRDPPWQCPWCLAQCRDLSFEDANGIDHYREPEVGCNSYYCGAEYQNWTVVHNCSRVDSDVVGPIRDIAVERGAELVDLLMGTKCKGSTWIDSRNGKSFEFSCVDGEVAIKRGRGSCPSGPCPNCHGTNRLVVEDVRGMLAIVREGPINE